MEQIFIYLLRWVYNNILLALKTSYSVLKQSYHMELLILTLRIIRSNE